MRSTLLVLLSTVLLCGCAHTVDEATALLAHSSGGPGPSVTIITVFENGIVELQSGQGVRQVSSPEHAHQILLLLRAPAIQDELAQLATHSYSSGCCDAEDITLRIDGSLVEFPVFELRERGPDVEVAYLVPPAILSVLEQVQLIATKLFPDMPFYKLIPSRTGG